MLKNLFKPKMRELPWIVEGKKVFGLHEKHNKGQLTRWLKSDGRRLGDTEKLPWCGDYVETAIKNALPNEEFYGRLKENPYWARNWIRFGVETPPVYGAILVFSRGNGGHVGFAVGQDKDDFYVLGGNQSNAVTISRISKSRLLAARWPASWKNPRKVLPHMSHNNIPKTTNEF